MGRDTVPGFADRLKELRKAAGLTQTELAAKVGSHFTAVAKIEAGDRAPSLRIALALADALGVSVYDMVLPRAKKAKGK